MCADAVGAVLSSAGSPAAAGRRRHNHVFYMDFSFIFFSFFCARMFEEKGEAHDPGIIRSSPSWSSDIKATRSDFKESIVKIQLREPRKIIAT